MTASWVCRVCGRRVPAAFARCRCGQLAAAPETPGRAAETAGLNVAVQSAGLLLVAATAVAAAVWWSNSQPITPPSAVPAPAAPALPGRLPTTVAEAPAETPAVEEPTPPDQSSNPAPAALEEIIGRALPGVAAIQTRASRGSGFFVRPDTVITNVHVVGSDVVVTVRRANNTATSARVEIRSPAFDPGNSGGPLINRNGEVIGVIKAGYLGNEGLSFAVSVDHVRAVLNGRTEDQPTRATALPVDEGLPLAVPPESDEPRRKAARDFEQAVSELARRADAFDRTWKSFVDQCYQGRIAGSFDRQWFALWDSRAMQGIVAPGCAPYFNDFRRQADELRQAVIAADEGARRAAVYPGVRRDVLRKFRLDYWTR